MAEQGGQVLGDVPQHAQCLIALLGTGLAANERADDPLATPAEFTKVDGDGGPVGGEVVFPFNARGDQYCRHLAD